jgi:regulator of sirC expression with transglutaminase-like and TPR domain
LGTAEDRRREVRAAAATLALCLLAGCRRPSVTEALMAGADADARRVLEEVVGRVEVGLRGKPAAEVLRDVVFGELGFSREVDDPDLRFMRLPAVLTQRRGSCYGLGALFVALGDRLGRAHGFTVAAVLVPGHLFVRVQDAAGGHNLELLRRGEMMPESWYRQRYEIPDAPEYLRPLDAREFLAVFDYNVGNDLRQRGRLEEAARSYERAGRGFPGLAEAHASLGLVRHLQGALPEALRAYEAARRANPRLPGLDRNIELLNRELGADR